MSLKRNICTKVISGGVVAMQILTSTIPAFGYDSLRQPDDFFNRFGSQKRDIIATSIGLLIQHLMSTC